MKKIIISSLGILLVSVFTISCRKSGQNGDPKALVSGSYIQLDSLVTQNLDFSNPDATVGIVVKEKGSPIATVDVYLGKGDDADDSANWVHIKSYPFKDGMTLNVSTTELANALAPDTIAPGNEYQLRNVVTTKDGRSFSIINTPENYTSFSSYKFAFRWKAVAVCAYTGNANNTGDYTIVQDDWQDWSKGDVVTVKAGAKENQLDISAIYPNPAYGNVVNPLLLDVDPETGVITIKPGLQWGDYGYIAEVDPGSDGSGGFVFSCTNTISVAFPLYAVGYGPQGTKKLILKKVQ